MARGIAIKGKRYKYLVMEVLDRDAQGRPSTVKLMYDEDVKKIVGGEHFWIVLANAEMFHGRKLN